MASLTVRQCESNGSAQRPDYVAVGGEALNATTSAEEIAPVWTLRRKFARGIAATSLVALVLAGATLTYTMRSGAYRAVQSHMSDIIEEVDWFGKPPCGLLERDVKYEVKAPGIGQYQDVTSGPECRTKCMVVAECHVWSWTPDGICWLLGVDQGEAPQRVPLPGATSGGMPCNMVELLGDNTLYCWALVKPGSYEQDLLADQYTKTMSIFQCEQYELISNQVLDVVPGLTTKMIDISLDCEMGGEFGTALNLDIFIAAWDKIVELGTFQSYDWTVKSDPDAVFFVDRLKAILPHHPQELKGVYLNNCKMGMHGPVEVLSKDALMALHFHWESCKSFFTQQCNGDCKWGEDMFIDQCLMKVAGVRRDDEWGLLVEDHCLLSGQKGAWDAERCDGVHVAFHPFKDTASYGQCVANAQARQAVAASQMNMDVPGR